jgi:hypothetical protein
MPLWDYGGDRDPDATQPPARADAKLATLQPLHWALVLMVASPLLTRSIEDLDRFGHLTVAA